MKEYRFDLWVNGIGWTFECTVNAPSRRRAIRYRFPQGCPNGTRVRLER